MIGIILTLIKMLILKVLLKKYYKEPQLYKPITKIIAPDLQG